MRSSQVTDAGPIARLALLTTAQTVFQNLTPRLGAPSLAAILAIPGTNRFTARIMEITASGVIYNAAAAASATINLAFGTDVNIANNQTFASTGALAVAATTAVPWWMQARLIYDNISGMVVGDYSAVVGTAIAARAAISSNLTGVNGINEPVFNVVLSAGLSIANAGNYALCDTFALEG